MCGLALQLEAERQLRIFATKTKCHAVLLVQFLEVTGANVPVESKTTCCDLSPSDRWYTLSDIHAPRQLLLFKTVPIITTMAPGLEDLNEIYQRNADHAKIMFHQALIPVVVAFCQHRPSSDDSPGQPAPTTRRGPAQYTTLPRNR